MAEAFLAGLVGFLVGRGVAPEDAKAIVQALEAYIGFEPPLGLRGYSLENMETGKRYHAAVVIRGKSYDAVALEDITKYHEISVLGKTNGYLQVANAVRARIEWSMKLSDIEIDVAKDWKGYRIENLGAPLAAGHALRRGDEAIINHNALLNYVAAQHLTLPNTIANVLTDHDLAHHPLSIIPNMDWAHISALFPRTIAELLSDHNLANHPLSIIPLMDDAHIPDVETLSYGAAFAAAQIPYLDASKIATGVLDEARIPHTWSSYHVIRNIIRLGTYGGGNWIIMGVSDTPADYDDAYLGIKNLFIFNPSYVNTFKIDNTGKITVGSADASLITSGDLAKDRMSANALVRDPDYDSGWFSVGSGQTVTLTHNLGTLNTMVYGEHSASSDGNNALPLPDFQIDSGYVKWLNKTATQIRVYNATIGATYARICMWKLA